MPPESQEPAGDQAEAKRVWETPTVVDLSGAARGVGGGGGTCESGSSATDFCTNGGGVLT